MNINSFTRKYCSHYYKEQNLCTKYDKECLIFENKDCTYFQQSVFPICDPSYKYASETGSYTKILKAYNKINPSVVETDEEVKRCECGDLLVKGNKFCSKCKEKKRKDGYKKYNKARKSA